MEEILRLPNKMYCHFGVVVYNFKKIKFCSQPSNFYAINSMPMTVLDF